MRFKAMINSLKDIIRTVIGFGIRLYPVFRRKLKTSLTVFVFHDVTDRPSEFDIEYGLSISTAAFSKYIEYINEHFNIIHPSNIAVGQALPERAALITFDDGFAGTFENGLRILASLNIPSVVFLNMGAISEKFPIKSAVASYLSSKNADFPTFAKSNNILAPFHLTLTEKILEKFETEFGKIDMDAVAKYQGHFADLNLIKKWNDPKTVIFGNHLYSHWNSAALTDQEFENEFNKNKKLLSQLENSLDIFAFPNGHPGTCFSESQVQLLQNWGVLRSFSARGGVNSSKGGFLLGRTGLNERFNKSHFWFRIARAIDF
jgi:peptidoglycan/xylan/chitin deacetylase (PgdA/CDA1 family)